MFNNNKYLEYNNVNWILPFLFTRSMLYIPVLKDLLKDEFKSVKYVYGSLNCLWAGGRPLLLEVKNLNTVEKILYNIKQLGVTPVFNFTNTLLNNDDLNDSYCNDLLKLLYETKSQVIVSSDLLHKYIKEKYPEIKQTASIIMFYFQNFNSYDDETLYINNLLSEYDFVVMRSEYFKEKYKNIEKEIKDLSKIVLIINSTCDTNCVHAKEHYNLISRFYKKEIEYLEGNKILANYCPKILNIKMNPNTLGHNYVKKALNMGINNIKVQGRMLDFNEMYKMLYQYFFNQKKNIKDLRNDIDRISANIIQNSIDMQFIELMKQKEGI